MEKKIRECELSLHKPLSSSQMCDKWPRRHSSLIGCLVPLVQVSRVFDGFSLNLTSLVHRRFTASSAGGERVAVEWAGWRLSNGSWVLLHWFTGVFRAGWTGDTKPGSKNTCMSLSLKRSSYLLIYWFMDWFISSSRSLSRHWNSHFIYNINISLFFQGTICLFSTALLWRTLLPFFHSPTFFFLSSILHLSSTSPSSSSSSSSPSSSSLLLVILLLHHLFFPRNLRQLSSITHRTGWRYYIVPRFSPVFCSYSPPSLLSSPPPSSQ